VAAALYTPPPKDEKPLNGFDISHFVADQEVEVWPENWQTVDVFLLVSTQWRVSMSGPVGLDYNVVFRLLDLQGLPTEEWKRLFEDIRVMESAAMTAMRQVD
jgi:hypothetical protein